MTLPLVVLAVGGDLRRVSGVPEGLSGGKIPNYFEHFLEPSIAQKDKKEGLSRPRSVCGRA
jgi:hypothetical protein